MITDPLLQRAFAEWKPLDTTSVDYRQFGRDLDKLDSQIDDINNQNWKQYVHFNREQDKMIKNINLDLSKVNPIHRQELRKAQLAQMDMLADKGIVNALQSQEFLQRNSDIAQNVSKSKQAYEYVNLLKKQMAKSKDFDNTKNNRDVELYGNLSLEDLDKSNVPTIEPIEARDFGSIVSSIYEKSKVQDESVYNDGSFYGINKSTSFGNVDDNIDIWIKSNDKYGNPNSDYVMDLYKSENPNVKEYSQEDANSWFAQTVKSAEPSSTNDLTGVKQVNYKNTPEGVVSEQASKEELARIKASSKKAKGDDGKSDAMRRNISIRVDSLKNKTRPINSKRQEKIVAELNKLDIDGIKSIKAITSTDVQISKAIGASGNQKVYQLEMEDGSTQYFAYGNVSKDNRNVLGSPINSQDLKQSLLGSSVTALTTDGFQVGQGMVMQYSDLSVSDFNPKKKHGGGTKVKNLDPELKKAYIGFNNEFNGLVITSGNDSTHGKNSKHYSNKAIDIRVKSGAGLKFKKAVLGNGTHISTWKDGTKVYDYKGYKIAHENAGGSNEHFHITLHSGARAKGGAGANESNNIKWQNVQNGDKYNGFKVGANGLDGSGIYKWKNGDEFRGVFKGNKVYTGVVTFSDGSVSKYKNGAVVSDKKTTKKKKQGGANKWSKYKRK